ncbi:MAG: hypothetical protein HYS12_25435 [Planctomycetes bacterium]|nr:hypothetical protein [Planctomycetota bacterium]
MEPVVSGLIAAILTLFDIDRVFYVPKKGTGKVILYCWWYGFVLANGLLAVVLYLLLVELNIPSGTSPWGRATLAGFGYLVLIRTKLATFTINEKDVPVGLELIYEKGKEFAFKRINRIVREARTAEAQELCDSKSTTNELVDRAELQLLNDSLLSDAQREETMKTITAIVNDKKIEDRRKRIFIAHYILTGKVTNPALFRRS